MAGTISQQAKQTIANVFVDIFSLAFRPSSSLKFSIPLKNYSLGDEVLIG